MTDVPRRPHVSPSPRSVPRVLPRSSTSTRPTRKNQSTSASPSPNAAARATGGVYSPSGANTAAGSGGEMVPPRARVRRVQALQFEWAWQKPAVARGEGQRAAQGERQIVLVGAEQDEAGHGDAASLRGITYRCACTFSIRVRRLAGDSAAPRRAVEIAVGDMDALKRSVRGGSFNDMGVSTVGRQRRRPAKTAASSSTGIPSPGPSISGRVRIAKEVRRVRRGRVRGAGRGSRVRRSG